MSEHNSKDVELSDNRARYMKDHEYTWEIIYHFNCGVKPHPRYWMEQTFKYLYGDL